MRRTTMPRFTAKQAQDHQRACDLVASDKPLTQDEKEFVLRSWKPGFDQVTKAAFFTPLPWAYGVAMNAQGPRRVVDLGAGIGALSYAFVQTIRLDHRYLQELELYAIESDPQFVEVGRRVVPEVNWICGNIFDPMVWMQIGHVDIAITNPPFGNHGDKPPRGFVLPVGPRHLQVVALICEHTSIGGVAILPTTDLPTDYDPTDPKSRPKRKDPGSYSTGLKRLLEMYPDLWLGTHVWQFDKGDFDGVAPRVDLVDINFERNL
jgi:hypothetical protein